MNEAMLSFLEIVKEITPWVLSWGFGIKAYRYVVGAFLGKDPMI